MIQEVMEITSFPPEHDLESLFSEDDDHQKPVFGICSSDEEFDSDSSASTHYHEALRVVPCSSSQTVIMPHVKIEVLSSKYAKPIEAIGFLDTGAGQTMINPEILKGAWKEQSTHFTAADGFLLHVKKQDIGIKLFPDCIVWHSSYRKGCSHRL